MKRIVHSLINILKVGIFCLFHQKVFKHNGTKTRYVFQKSNNSSILLVVFSGFSGPYKKGRYNYIRSLSSVSANKLFIRDDDGFFKVGTYYFGNNCKKYKNESILELIRNIKTQSKITKVVTFGSSKGGSCSLLYGLMSNASLIICGSPQLYLGTYLSECDYHKKILEPILDIKDGYDVCFLNNCIVDIINKKIANSKIYLLFSSREKNYPTHINPLIELLDCQKYNVTKIDCFYDNHSDIGIEMKKFIKRELCLLTKDLTD